MDNEQTNKADTSGSGSNKSIEKPLNDLEEAKKARDEFKAENDRREKIIKEEKDLEARRSLSGTGGHIEPKTENPAQKMADEMVKAFK